MPKAKSTISREEKGSKNKARRPLRDIKPGNKPRNSFTVHHVRNEDSLSVEPLIENASDVPVNFNVERIESESDYDDANNAPHLSISSVQDFEEDEEYEEYEKDSNSSLRTMEELPPKETVKVKFSKFVQLVANHDFGDVVDANANEEIIMSSNLLTELAGAHDQRGEKKIPLVFLVGIAIGVVLTYILFST